MKTKIVSGIAIVMLSFFISCDSSNDGNDNNPTLTAKDIAVNSKIDVAIDDVVYIVEDQYTAQQSISNRSSTASKSILPTCATFTTVLVDGTWTRTIDFGCTGCTLSNGNILKGKIIISFSNNFTSKFRTFLYRFVDFYHNGKLLQGNKSITYESKSTELLATEHPVMTFTVDMKITFDDGKVYSRTGTTVKETVEGNETPLNWEDNVFLVTGNSATSLANGDTVTNVITTPLRYITSCKLPFPVSGIVSITKNTSVGTLDFGDGKCDNLATLTIDGVTKDINLEK